MNGGYLWAVLFSIVDKASPLVRLVLPHAQADFCIQINQSAGTVFPETYSSCYAQTILYAVVRPPERIGTRVTNDRDHRTRAFP